MYLYNYARSIFLYSAYLLFLLNETRIMTFGNIVYICVWYVEIKQGVYLSGQIPLPSGGKPYYRSVFMNFPHSVWNNFNTKKWQTKQQVLKYD